MDMMVNSLNSLFASLKGLLSQSKTWLDRTRNWAFSSENILEFYCLFPGILYLLVFGLINLQLYDHPYAIKLDIISDLRIMNRLISIKSFEDFLVLFFFKIPEAYHGFITLYIPALLTAIPRHLWGELAQIYLFKMIGAFLTVASYWIYSITFFGSKLYRVCIFMVFLALPYTNMLSTWPRCESYLFFFTAIFLYLQIHRPAYLAKSYFFLGLAAISRISIIPYTPFFVTFGLFMVSGQVKTRREFFKFLFQAFFYLLLGILVAQPHLLNVSNLEQYVTSIFFQTYQDTGNREYVNSTYWKETYVSQYVGNPLLLHFILVFTFIMAIPVIRKMRSGSIRLHMDPNAKRVILSLLTLLPAVICMGLIIFTVKIDHSGQYLQHHFMFILLTFFLKLNLLGHYFQRTRYLTLIFTLAFSLYLISPQFPGLQAYKHKEYNILALAQYTQSTYFKQKLLEYNNIIKALDRFSKMVGRRVNIKILPEQFQPSSTDGYRIIPHWWPSPFYLFRPDEGTDGIVFLKDKYRPPQIPQGGLSSLEEKIIKKGLRLYQQFVVPEFGGVCRGDHCFTATPITEELYLFYPQSLLPAAPSLDLRS